MSAQTTESLAATIRAWRCRFTSPAGQETSNCLRRSPYLSPRPMTVAERRLEAFLPADAQTANRLGQLHRNQGNRPAMFPGLAQ